MEAKELRIGNFIDCEATTHVITEISRTLVRSYWLNGSEKDDYVCCYGEIEPIPLTKEWLIRFRFDFSKNTFWYKGFCYSIDVVNGVFILYHDKSSPFHGVEIQYVHQLQNIFFALTGQELTFNK